MSYRRFQVKFEVAEFPSSTTEIVIVTDGIVDGASAEERAVVAAAEMSPFSHTETLAVQEVETV
jgi:hypothetical protein